MASVSKWHGRSQPKRARDRSVGIEEKQTAAKVYEREREGEWEEGTDLKKYTGQICLTA